MYTIKYLGYDISELTADLAFGEVIKSPVVNTKKFPRFRTIAEALKRVCEVLHTTYRKNDWCYEEEVCDYGDAWVLHIIVDKNNKLSTEKMIEDFKAGNLVLRDLLVNVVIEEIPAK